MIEIITNRLMFVCKDLEYALSEMEKLECAENALRIYARGYPQLEDIYIPESQGYVLLIGVTSSQYEQTGRFFHRYAEKVFMIVSDDLQCRYTQTNTQYFEVP